MMAKPSEKIQLGIDARFISHPGIGRYVAGLIASLPDDIRILAICNPDDCEDVLHLRPSSDVVTTPATTFGVREQFSIPRILYNRGVDCFHATQFTVPLRWSGPLVTTIHDCAYDLYPSEYGDRGRLAQRYLRTMMQLAISKSDRIITPSDSTQRDIRRLYTGGDLCTTVYHGVDTSRFNPNARVPESVDADYLLYVGSARPRKNITGLLDGFGRVVAQSRSPPRLVLAGGHDSRFVDLDSYVSRLGLEEYVIRPGYVDEDELLGLYANARAFVFPSHYEGFGFPVLEAMASGTPVVASDAAALPEVCGDAARYVDPTDAGDIASGIIDVLNDHTFSECLVKRGTKRATEFTWERTAHLTAAIYSQVCGRE